MGEGGQEKACPRCNGTGYVTTVQRSIFGQMQSSSPCPDCGGEGTVVDMPCSHCGGEGRVRTHERLDVEVPAGVATGRQLRLRGYGEAGYRGAASGDLIVTIQVDAHERFERHGDDLVCDVHVGIAEAALGCVVEVEGHPARRGVRARGSRRHAIRQRPDGGRPRHAALGRGGSRGRFVAHVVVDVPARLSAEAREALERYAEAAGEHAAGTAKKTHHGRSYPRRHRRHPRLERNRMTRPFACVVNLGCRVNRVESDRITSDLASAGFALVDQDEADLVVINTCAVTGEAEAKTRKAVRHALGLPREPLVVVTGCVVNLHPGALTELSPRVIAEPSKIDVARTAARAAGLPPRCAGASGEGHDLADLLGRSRLGIKVQDGCNNRCSYCIVWKARGPERSVPVEAVLDQVREAERAGIPEVVLTGGSTWARTTASTRAMLTWRSTSCSTSSCARRTSSRCACRPSSPWMWTSASSTRWSPAARASPLFLHLPLQSGCSATLERMNRPYTAEQYEATVAMIRAKLPAASISCDIIAGFPGETDDEFAQSLALCEHVGFSRMHVFRYSAPGDARRGGVRPGAARGHGGARERAARRRRALRPGRRRRARGLCRERRAGVRQPGHPGQLSPRDRG